MGVRDRTATALERLEEELSRAAGADVRLERPGKPEHGDYATNVALQLAGVRRRPPMEIAAGLRDVAAALPGVEDAAVAPPGFLNLRMSSAWFGEALAEIGDDYGAGSAETRERVQVELVSANPTGPLTVGSGRNGAYGDSVARLLEFAGHEVSREHYVNDAGGQADIFRASVAARARGEDPPEGGYLGAYVQELADTGGDPVELMLARIQETLERFGVHVDDWVRESELESEIRAALAELDGHTFEADGAVWLRSTSFGDDKDRVLLRADGRPTYLARDAAHTRWKYARGFDRLIYVLGSDHHGYVVRLKALAAASGHELDSVEVLLYQLVHLTEAGEARKVSKRRGDVVLLEELMDEIGVDAARWYLVKSGHEQTIDIDVDLARERSEKNPVYYVQYAHARIAGILRNAGEAEASADPPAEIAQEERELVKRLLEFPALVAEATDRRGPHALTTYAIRVADDFHRFYHHHRVLESDAQAFRLALCRAVRSVIARSLELVGVAAPERM
jgi:arginyl-tRNA synthetase